LGLALERPQARGSVRLRDRNAATPPLVSLNLLGEAEDRQRLVDGVELIRRIAGQGPLAEVVADASLLPDVPPSRRF
jgi:choline dehydrogenase